MDTRDLEDLTADAKGPGGAVREPRTSKLRLEPTVSDGVTLEPTIAAAVPLFDRSDGSGDESGTRGPEMKPEISLEGPDRTALFASPRGDEFMTEPISGSGAGCGEQPAELTWDRESSAVAGETVSLGPYVLASKLGQGGMGIVYLAWDRERNATVALKFLPKVNPMSLYRFKREFRAHADLSHRNLIKLYELYSRGDRWFYTMEHVVGLEFRMALRAGSASAIVPFAATEPDPSVMAHATLDRTLPLPPTDSAVPRPEECSRPVLSPPPCAAAAAPIDLDWLRALFEQLAHGLNATHEAGLLHRDIKSSNVMVGTDGRVVILDFGLVTDLVVSAGSEPNRRPIVGTIDTMSPEQARGGELTAASDWYSVGAMLYEALTGQKPFVGSTAQIFERQAEGQAPPAD